VITVRIHILEGEDAVVANKNRSRVHVGAMLV